MRERDPRDVICQQVDLSYDTNPYEPGYTQNGWGAGGGAVGRFIKLTVDKDQKPSRRAAGELHAGAVRSVELLECRGRGCVRVQAPQERQGVRQMALAKAFRETVYDRAQRYAGFRKALLTEAVNAYLGGDDATGKAA